MTSGSAFATWPESFRKLYRAAGLWQGETIGDWFRRKARAFSDREFIVDGLVRRTYAETLHRSEAIAEGLRRVGLSSGDRVVLQAPNGAAFVEAFFGIILAELVPVLALPGHRELELSALASGAGARAFLCAPRSTTDAALATARKVRERASSIEFLVALGSETTDSEDTLFVDGQGAGAHSSRRPETSPEALALLQLSGGSTGVPKLIPRTHDDYLYSVRASAELCRLTTASRLLCVLPMAHNFTLSSPGVLGVVDAGGTVVTTTSTFPEVSFGLIRDERINIVPLVPALARSWALQRRRILGSSRWEELLVQVGGARLDESLAQIIVSEWGCKLQQVFGMAEGLVNYTRLDDPLTTIIGTQGRPLSIYDEVRIVPIAGAPGDHGSMTGELETRGPYTIRGYYARLGGEEHFSEDGFYRTGDVVELLEGGNLRVLGRIGARISRGGEKFSPEEVEVVVRGHPAVAEALIVGRADEELGQRTLAFVVLRTGATLSLPILRKFLREAGLAEFKLPDVLQVVEQLPTTNVGKLDRRILS